MKASVIVFPGSNSDRDVAVSIHKVTGSKPEMVWHGDSVAPESDLIVLPGGFSYGDYLRAGSMAAQSPIMKDIIAKAKSGVPVLGICNGFQILTESGLLPGILMRNASLRFICKDVHLTVERDDTIFSKKYTKGSVITIPVSHHDGNYFADDETLKMVEGEGRVAFRYSNLQGRVDVSTNPNGARNNIAGIYNETGRILGLMPHPERLADGELGGTDGVPMFESLLETLH